MGLMLAKMKLAQKIGIVDDIYEANNEPKCVGSSEMAFVGHEARTIFH